MGKFIIERKPSEEYSFELRAANGEAVISGPDFPARESCENGIDAVRRDCLAHVEDRTLDGCASLPCPKFEIYRDRSEHYCFRLFSANNEIIAVSQRYTSKASCIKGIDSVGSNAPDAEISNK